MSELYIEPIIETPRPNQLHGNQILITSSSTGYTLHPIIGSFIAHYTILPLKDEQAKEFAQNWLNEAGHGVDMIDSMFEILPKNFAFNPWLLSLICTSIIQSTQSINYKSQIEFYDYIVQALLSQRRIQQSPISKTFLIDFLIDLAVYLHIQSPSNLIDEFDIKQLCTLILRQQPTKYLFNNRKELYKCVDNIIDLLNTNLGFLAHQELQVYSFQDSLFQDYFVARGFIRSSSIEDMAKRILSFAINFRFHQAISLAIQWMSYNRSHDYERFCQYLINTADQYTIPFGIILLFNSIDQMKILPSNEILILGLNKLFNHPSYLIISTYFFANLSTLPNEIIIEWMQNNLKDFQSLSKFYLCFMKRRDKNCSKTPSIICQQLWSFHSRSVPIEFDIDQILRIVMIRDNLTDQTFNKHLALHLSPNIHPLILAVVIAICGGVYYTMEKSILKMNFSSQKMHRESNVFGPIIKYLRKQQELNFEDIQTLTKQYEENLKQFSLTDRSSDAVDTCIALICLKGVSDLSFYEKYVHYQALSLAIERFKWNWFHFMISGLCIDLGTCTVYKTSQIESEIETIINMFSSQRFSVACSAALRKLRIFDKNGLPKILKTNEHQSNVLLTCLPKSLQKLYAHSASVLPDVVFLIDCLNQIEHIVGDGPMVACALSIFIPLLIEHSLENYALTIFRKKYPGITEAPRFFPNCDEFYIRQVFNWQTLIDIEHKRIIQNKKSTTTNLQLFSASISFLRILQGAHRENVPVDTHSITCKEVFTLIRRIDDPILRIIAFNIILHMVNPMVADLEQKHEMCEEMIGVLFSILSDLPLLTSSYLFIRCYQQRLHYPQLFQQMSIILSSKFNESQESAVAFVALRQLHDPYLTLSLPKSINLSDLLELNSPIFQYYLQTKSTFPTCNINLLSVMYLNELTFDIETIKIPKETNEDLSSAVMKLLKQLWQESSRFDRILTYDIANVITKNIRNLNKNTIIIIIRDIFRSVSIEKRALPIIQQWLDYKFDQDLYPFAQFAAVELIIAGLDRIISMEIINEMFNQNNCDRLLFIAERLFNSPTIDLQDLRQILIEFKQHNYLSKISIDITRKESLDLIFQLEFEQQSNENTHPSYLLILKHCPFDLEIYLKYQLENFMNEEIIAIIIECIIQNNTKTKCLELIFALLHDFKYPQIQMIIIGILDSSISGKSLRSIHWNMIEHFQIIINDFKNYSKDFLNICLLSYGKLLLRLQLSKQMNRNIFSNIIEEKLYEIYKEYFREIISIRAGFCLRYGKGLHGKKVLTNSWFIEMSKDDRNLQLTILLQQTLYPIDRQFYSLTEIKEYFDSYPISMNTFVVDLYNYLENEDDNHSPDYIYITQRILKTYLKQFLNAVRNSSFGEKQFRTKLYNHSKKYPDDCSNAFHIYSTFGIVTNELLDMLDLLDKVNKTEDFNP